MEPGTVTVRGTATASGRPDDLRIGLLVTVVEASPEAALDDVAGRSAGLAALLDGVGVPVSDRTTSAIAVGEVREWEGDRQVHRGYRASARMVVRLTDGAAVGPLLARAMTTVRPAVSGPTWRMAADNPARAEACGLAVADARRRAVAYAEALGGRLGEVIAVAEAGTGPGPDGWMTLAAGEFDRPGSAEALPVEPGEIDVTASVDVMFRLET